MRRFASPAAFAFALANLYLLFLTGPLVSPAHQLIFHLPGSATVLFMPVLLDLGLVWLGLTLLLHWAQPRPRAEMVLWATLLVPLPWILLRTVASFAGQPARPAWLWIAGLAAATVWGAISFRSLSWLPQFRRLRPALVTTFRCVALSGLVILGQLLWLGWKTRHLNGPFLPRVAGTPSASAQSPRVVWILLDELSYRQVYGHRAPGLKLPNFDRLASGSTVFTQAVPTAEYTRIAVPSLLTGLPLSATAPAADGQTLLLHGRGQRHWQTLDPAHTVFGDVAGMGLPTAIAGWYEPYCRLLPRVLEQCFWTYRDNIPGALSDAAPILQNTLQPFRSAGLSLLHEIGVGPGTPSEDAQDAQQHAADYQALLAAGDQMLLQQTAGLVLLHMPIPHPWGFYDRRNGSFPGHRTSYLDNLALADAYLGHVRALLEQTGSWDKADVIVMGDHGWRSDRVWKESGFWTPEEDAASQGAPPDDAPALVVKLHGQTLPAHIDTPFDAVNTRALIDALFARQLEMPGDLQRWVKMHPRS